MFITGTSSAITNQKGLPHKDNPEIDVENTNAPWDAVNIGVVRIRAEIEDLINSEDPATVTANPATGVVESVVPT